MSIDRQKLRQMAAGLLAGDSGLAASLNADLQGRKHIGHAETEAISRSLREAGFTGGFYSMASQYRHPDWQERDAGAPRPTGPVQTLYHFTSVVHLPVVLEFGLARGDVCIEPHHPNNYNAPWLTSDPSYSRQGWAEQADGRPNSTFDKRDVRLSVVIPLGDPALSSWDDICRRENVPDYWRKVMHAMGEEHWLVYNGRIPRAWIVAVEFRHKPALEHGRFGIMRGHDLSLDKGSP